MDQTHQGAVPSRKESPLERKYNESNLSHLHVRTLALIFDIEQLIEKPHLIDTTYFLDRLATNIVSLYAEINQPNNRAPVFENKLLIANILTCNVAIKYRSNRISLLDAASIYRKNKDNKDPLILICESMLQNLTYTRPLLNELKLIAFDFNAEMGNI